MKNHKIAFVLGSLAALFAGVTVLRKRRQSR